MRSSRGVWILLLVVVALAVAIYAGLHDRRGADAALKRATQEAAVPTVAVTYPAASSPSDELVLPGTARAFTDAPIYARASFSSARTRPPPPPQQKLFSPDFSISLILPPAACNTLRGWLKMPLYLPM